MIKITPPPSPQNFQFPPPGEGIPLYLLKLFGESDFQLGILTVTSLS